MVLVFVEVTSTMPGKKVKCKHCSKFMRSDNLKHHAESCHHSQVASIHLIRHPWVSTGNNKRVMTAQIISDSGKSDETDHHPRNQKIQKLVNEIINDDVTSVAEVSSSPSRRFDHKDALSTTAPEVPPEVIPPTSRTKGDSYSDYIERMGSHAENSEIVEEVFSSMINSMPRTKEGFIFYF